MPNHVACERRKGGEHWRVLSTFAESAESGVFTRMPNQELRHHTALCESGINFRRGHGEEAASAELFCGMLRPDLLWGGSCICRAFLRNASARCALCRDESFPNLHTAPLYRDSRWWRSSDSAVLNLAESERVSMCTALIRRS